MENVSEGECVISDIIMEDDGQYIENEVNIGHNGQDANEVNNLHIPNLL